MHQKIKWLPQKGKKSCGKKFQMVPEEEKLEFNAAEKQFKFKD